MGLKPTPCPRCGLAYQSKDGTCLSFDCQRAARLDATQREAAAQGRRAEAAGLPVIHVHGRPYPDPGAT